MVTDTHELTLPRPSPITQSTASLGKQLETIAGMIRRYIPSRMREEPLPRTAMVLADQLEETGHYLQQESIQRLIDSTVRIVRRYPVPVLLIGAGVGYLLTRSLTR